ncbi:MAG: PEP-CTERM sorting domain-containing protein [Akkermansiaceae bacterium]
MKKTLLTGIIISVTTVLAQATITVVDTPDGLTINPSHAGSDIVALADSGGQLVIGIASGAANFGGDTGAGIVFTDGSTDLNPAVVVPAPVYQTGGIFQDGADLGLNYVRLDMNQNGTYEAVVEFTTGTINAFSDDVITRYAYDSNDANLSIPDAVAAFAVPEPSSVLLLGLSGVGFVFRRRK